jgi:hypothetical protein
MHGHSGDVSESWYVGPVFCEDGAAVGVDLDLGDAFPAGALEAEVDSSDSSEKTDESHSSLMV